MRVTKKLMIPLTLACLLVPLSVMAEPVADTSVSGDNISQQETESESVPEINIQYPEGFMEVYESLEKRIEDCEKNSLSAAEKLDMTNELLGRLVELLEGYQETAELVNAESDAFQEEMPQDNTESEMETEPEYLKILSGNSLLLEDIRNTQQDIAEELSGTSSISGNMLELSEGIQKVSDSVNEGNMMRIIFAIVIINALGVMVGMRVFRRFW